MIVLDGQSCHAHAQLTITELRGPWSILARVLAALVLAIIVVMSAVCAFAVVVVRAALVLWICMALVVQMLRIRPLHVAGLLGEPFVRSLVVAAAPVICLALTLIGPLARLTTVFGVVPVAPPAVLTPLAIR